MSRCQRSLSQLLLLVSLVIPASGYANIATDFTGVTQNGFQAELVLGWSFNVNSTITVDGLGFFDDFLIDGQGLINDHLVSLWTDDALNPQLLAQTLITNASSPVASTAADGQWLFNNIGAVILTPGDYVIGAHTPACSGPDCDRFRLANTATTIPQITLLQPRSGTGMNFPGSPNDVEDGYFGPTFSATANVPEPGSAALIVAITGVTTLLRRKRSSWQVA